MRVLINGTESDGTADGTTEGGAAAVCEGRTDAGTVLRGYRVGVRGLMRATGFVGVMRSGAGLAVRYGAEPNC